ncbi:MAG: hypothetical protein M3P11_04255 [Actinomycetota bacterium]|nr:hypothetical protein [Actinomycetota bacterium]
MGGAVAYGLFGFLGTGIVLYALYRITLDVSAIRALLEKAAASQEQQSN